MTAHAQPQSWRVALHRYGYPLFALVGRDVRKRYTSTALGMYWAFIQPLALIGLYVLVFGFILHAPASPGGGPADFTFYLLSGTLPYLALSDGVQRASSSLRENRTLVDRSVFPVVTIPVASVLVASVAEVVGLTILLLAIVAFGRPLNAWVLLLPLLVVARVALTLGIAWILSIVTVFVDDLREVVSLALTAWLFLTPVFYSAASVPAALRWTLLANPLVPLLACYRAALLDGQPSAGSLVAALLWSVVLGAAGLRFFQLGIGRAKDLL